MSEKHTVLLVDDELDTLDVLEATLSSAGYAVLKTDRGRKALELISDHSVDLAFVDYRMPEMDGLELLSHLRNKHPDLPVIMLTATESIQLAVQAIKAGAYDYLNKPFNYHQIQIVAQKALSARKLWQENAHLKRELRRTTGPGVLVGRSRAMQQVFHRIERASENEATVLIQGENGTGKELIARAIHEGSHRRDRPFIAVDCAAIPASLLESELFGHEKGAFTGADRLRRGKFELAHGGTLFLDEIGEMHIEGQAKVLRALQERQFTRLGGEKPLRVDIRIIAATNKPLEEAIRTGQFRQDLYYRLHVIKIEVPPLRERLDDIALLVECFLEKYCPEGQRKQIAPEALRALMQAEWPGNVRQLENVIHSALALCEGPVISLSDLPPQFNQATVPFDRKIPEIGALPSDESIALPERMRKYEKALVELALAESGGVEKAAAAILGISERSMWHLVKKHEIETRRKKRK